MAIVGLGLILGGLLLLALGGTWAFRSFREGRELGKHVGARPVSPLANARVGDVVHVLGQVTSPDLAVSPTGARSSAHLAVDLVVFAVGMPSYLKLRHGEQLEMRDASGSATVQMALANCLDRQPYEAVWFSGQPSPARVRPVLERHGIRISKPPINKSPLELRYRETALRQGDPLRVHGLVMDVSPGPDGRPHVTLGTDQRVWLYVSNTTAEDLRRLGAASRKWLLIGLATLLGGLVMTAGGVAIGILGR